PGGSELSRRRFVNCLEPMFGRLLPLIRLHAILSWGADVMPNQAPEDVMPVKPACWRTATQTDAAAGFSGGLSIMAPGHTGKEHLYRSSKWRIQFQTHSEPSSSEPGSPLCSGSKNAAPCVPFTAANSAGTPAT